VAGTHRLAVGSRSRSVGLAGKDINSSPRRPRARSRVNRACLESVMTYEQRWRAVTERSAAVDLDHPYLTY
jgi:hypothetical protein